MLMLRNNRVLCEHCTAGDFGARAASVLFPVADFIQCMFNLAVAIPSTNDAVMDACLNLAALNADASIAVATSVIMEHIGSLWRSDPSSTASATGAAICQTASNMVPSACDALVQAGFSAAAASAACRANDPECFLKLLVAFAADDGCVELMIRQGPFMMHLSGIETRMTKLRSSCTI
jgi:hypothetical protein